jgi:hypothetical protein
MRSRQADLMLPLLRGDLAALSALAFIAAIVFTLVLMTREDSGGRGSPLWGVLNGWKVPEEGQ